MLKANSIQYLYDKTSDMELIFCHNSSISYPLHNNVSVFTIGLVTYGSISLSVGNKAKLYEANHTFIIYPYAPHTINVVTPYTLLTLCIHKNTVIHCNRAKIKQSLQQKLAAVPELHLIALQITQLVNSLDLINGYSELPFAKPYIEPIKSQLERCPEKPLSLKEMADAAYISKYHFIRSFKQVVGLTPHQFQIQNRIRQAQHLLNDIDSITEVALATGFCDQSHFIKHFEKYVGLTPTDYKTARRLFPSNSPN